MLINLIEKNKTVINESYAMQIIQQLAITNVNISINYPVLLCNVQTHLIKRLASCFLILMASANNFWLASFKKGGF